MLPLCSECSACASGHCCFVDVRLSLIRRKLWMLGSSDAKPTEWRNSSAISMGVCGMCFFESLCQSESREAAKLSVPSCGGSSSNSSSNSLE